MAVGGCVIILKRIIMCMQLPSVIYYFSWASLDNCGPVHNNIVSLFINSCTCVYVYMHVYCFRCGLTYKQLPDFVLSNGNVCIVNYINLLLMVTDSSYIFLLCLSLYRTFHHERTRSISENPLIFFSKNSYLEIFEDSLSI